MTTDTDSSRGEAKFRLGDRVAKISGSRWQGYVVGTYSTSLTPEGYAVESDSETGSVQIYPAKALRHFYSEQARAALSIPQSEPTLTEAEEAELVERINNHPYIPQSEAGEREVNCPHCWQPMTQGKDARWRCNNYGEDCPAVRGNLEFSTPTAQTEGSGLAEELGAIVQGARGKCANTFYVPVKSELCDRILTALRTQEASRDRGI